MGLVKQIRGAPVLADWYCHVLASDGADRRVLQVDSQMMRDAMKGKVPVLLACATFSVVCHAGETRCVDRIAQGSVAVVRVVPGKTVQIDLPPGVRVGNDERPDAGTKVYYKGGATSLPLSFPTNQGRYDVCAVLAKAGEQPDQHVVLTRHNP